MDTDMKFEVPVERFFVFNSRHLDLHLAITRPKVLRDSPGADRFAYRQT